MKKYTTIAAFVALCALAACGSTPADKTKATVATVSALEASLAASGRVVLSCYSVPACAAVAPKAQIRAAYDTAYTSVTQAQAVADAGGTPDVTGTTAAISALQGLLTTLPVTPVAASVSK